MKSSGKFGSLIAATAMLVAGALSQASAHHYSTVSNIDSACPANYRIPEADATCLRGRTGVGTHDYELNNLCSSYGQVVVSIDVMNTTDTRVTLHKGSSEVAAQLAGGQIRAITCCIDRGDNLCYKDQVEKREDGRIRFYNHPVASTRDVSTHQARYDLCQAHPTNIYCKVNPEGDAFTEPAAAPSTETHTLGDCYDAWEDSDAYDDGCRTDVISFSSERDGRTAYGKGVELNDQQHCTATGEKLAVDCTAYRNGMSETKGPLKLEVDSLLTLDQVDDVKYCAKWHDSESRWDSYHRGRVYVDAENGHPAAMYEVAIHLDACKTGWKPYTELKAEVEARSDTDDDDNTDTTNSPTPTPTPAPNVGGGAPAERLFPSN